MNNNNLPEKQSATTESPVNESARWELIRDLIVFQFKLALDGLRDLLLSPVSIATALFGLFFGGHEPGKHFYALLHWGHKTDRWISLFSASDDKYPQSRDPAEKQDLTTDAIVTHIEQVMKDEFAKGGLVSTTKNGVDGLLDRFKK
jgi:hypothetical protein